MKEPRSFNKKERIKIYRLARRIFKGYVKTESDLIYRGLCHFIADAVIKLHQISFYNKNSDNIYSPFNNKCIEKYWPELHAERPDIYMVFWFDDDELRGEALDRMINNKSKTK